MYVKPANSEIKVRDPRTMDHIPEVGRNVPETPYWRRRLRDGDVVTARPPKPTKAKE
ncbi:DUF2635 domain-containing protein [Kaustia mangrovi]|uniref:DUF2635 domain-containing protein n=1 Tax=Kaustia mangrovi TaxID=2593653 RepID=A0A7S8C600_9HYPH|nr:DUF2635 domain-containing protein [Kaustia mangrovi]QPC44004.1 DUF2635 domain-containing protein [Kaustia mangrovi]